MIHDPANPNGGAGFTYVYKKTKGRHRKLSCKVGRIC